jgi:GT2 family glycosyltransferase
MSDTPQVSIIIPTWNQRDLLVACIESLKGQTFQDFEIVVVDDCGSDDTVEVLARDFPQVRIVCREKNGGFAKAVNAGLAEATGALLFILNNDMMLEADCMALLVNAAECGAADIVGPLILAHDDHGEIYSAGDRIHVNGRPESIGFRQRLDTFDFSDPVFGITAGALLCKREVFDGIGLFDERFTAYFEDADLNFRARLAGFTCALVREAVVYHHGAASIQDRLWWRTRQCYRNHVFLVVKSVPLALLFRHGFAIIAETFRGAGRTFSAVRCHRGAMGACLEIVRVRWEIFLALPHLTRERWRIQRGRTLTAKAVEALLYRDKGGST